LVLLAVIQGVLVIVLVVAEVVVVADDEFKPFGLVKTASLIF